MLKLTDIMTRDVVTVAPETSLRDVVELFTAKHISGAPVVSGHEVVGVISAADILGVEVAPPEAEAMYETVDWPDAEPENAGERDNLMPGSYYADLFSDGRVDVVDRIRHGNDTPRHRLDEYAVDDVMTREPITLPSDANVYAAADVMQRRGIHRVLVVDAGKLVGIVSALDVARAVAQQKLTTTTFVFGTPVEEFETARRYSRRALS